jgi:hypothetical protein
VIPVSEFTERDIERFAKHAPRKKRRERARISIDRILDAQPLYQRKWFRVSELLNHCANIPGMLLCDPSRKEEAFEIFRASIYRGEFGGSVGRPTRIRWISVDPSAPRFLSRDSAAPNGFLFPLIDELLISRVDAAAWFLRHGVSPPHWLAEAHDERQPTEQQVRPSSGTSGMPPGYDESISEQWFKPASLEEIKQAIHSIYDAAETSGAKPPNIKELPPQVRDLLTRSRHTASGRQIQEVGSLP